MDWKEIKAELEFPFASERIHWRVGATTRDKDKAVPLAYIDARDAMERLDSVMGVDWQCRYTLAEGSLLICEVGLKIDGEWRWRSNGAGDTHVEAEKGKSSDAFKRACVLWGIGRYLYDLPNVWLPYDAQRRKFKQAPTLPAWATPEHWKPTGCSFVEHMEAVRANSHSLVAIQDALAAGEFGTAKEAWNEITEADRHAIWRSTSRGGFFTPQEREQMKSNDWSAAA